MIYLGLGILVFLFLASRSLAGRKKHDLKLKPNVRHNATTGTQVDQPLRKNVGASNVDMWRTVSPWAKKAARECGATLIGKGILREGEPDRRDEGSNPYAKGEMTEATRNSLRDLIIKAIDNGWTVNQLQHEIIAKERLSPDSALTIAWTETALAQAYGTHESARSVGMKLKEWLAAKEHTCGMCQANARQGRIPIDTPFHSGNIYPPGHTRCRCAAGYYETQEGD